jgi:asparagine synthase (glutamine-hydrolysing)
MANVLKRYGPDRQKVLIRGSAAFAYCLHRFTPEDLFEQQPLLLANRIVMLFDGRIDNRNELGERLGISSSDLGTMPDSLIALRLFDRWGEIALEHIVGAFALIAMDLTKGQILCARDQLGLRALHYHYSSKRFAVATAPEALFSLSWVPRILNRDKVGDTLIQRGLNGETTYYREVFRVLPASIVRVSQDKLSKTRFWHPERLADVRFKTDQQYVEAFRDRLDAAVKARLRSLHTPCSTLTGGLDSSSIAVVAADMLAKSGKKLNTYTAVPEPGFAKPELRGCYFDETPYVRQIAAANPNIIPHFVGPSKGPILDQIAEQIRLGGAPAGSILNGLWVMDMYRAARAGGHNVMLSGEMGNITMSYDGWGLLPELLRSGRWLRLVRELKASGYKRKFMLRHWAIAPFIPLPLFRRYKQWRRGGKPPWFGYSLINPDFAQESAVVERAAREYLAFDSPPPKNSKLSRINDFNCYSETADWFTKVRAGFGIDVRTPAFDRRLVEFCVAIPTDQYLRDGTGRWLIRRAMKQRLPENVLANTKRGAQAADWFPRMSRERTLIAEKIQKFAANEEVAAMVDIPRLSTILDTWPESEPPEYTSDNSLLLAVPQALGAAVFIEEVIGANMGR